jgi:glycosyltransferase involved in cell wall biosynthesis
MMKLAAMGHRILFVEPSQSVSSLFSSTRTNPLIGYRSRDVEFGIKVLTPPLALPLRHSPPGKFLNASRLTSAIRRELKTLKRAAIDVLWVYEPRFSVALKYLKYSKLVFDMVDDYLSDDYGGRNLEEGTRVLLEKSDLSIFTTNTLSEQYAAQTIRGCVVPNGYNPELFGTSDLPSPDDFPQFKGPSACMSGTLFHHLDYVMMARIAKALQPLEGGLILVGPMEDSEGADLRDLLGMVNVFWLGAKPYEAVPSYINNADFCIATFRQGRVARSVSPLKLYEYLGCGKPVLVSGLTSFREDPLYSLVYDLDDIPLEHALELSLAEGKRMRAERADRAAASASWDARFEQLRPHLNGVLQIPD